MNIEKIEKLLNNIENLTNIEKIQLKNYIVNYKIITQDEYMNLYNSLNETQLNNLIEIVGIKNISDEFVKKINNKNCLIFPYNNNDFDYKWLLQNNEQLQDEVYKSKIFYSGFKDMFYINMHIETIKNETLKKTFAKNTIKYVPNFYDFEMQYQKNSFLSALDEEDIIDIMKHKKDSDNLLGLYSILNDETKIKVIKEKWFTNIVDINYFINKNTILKNSPNEIIEQLINEKTSFFNLINLYEDSKKIIFLKYAIDRFDITDLNDEFLARKILNNIFFVSNKKLEELGEDKSKLINLINSLDDNLFIKYYFNLYIEHEVFQLMTTILNEKAKNILENNNIIIDNISSNIIKSNNKEILDLIIKNTTKENLLLLSIRNKYINNCVLNILENDPNYFENTIVSNINKFFTPKIDENKENFLKIANFISKEQYKIFFIKNYIENDSNITYNYINFTIKNPEFLASFNDLSLFYIKDVKNILTNLDINKLMYLVTNTNINIHDDKDLLLTVNEILKNRLPEIIDYINDEKNNLNFAKTGRYGAIFFLLDPEDIKHLINEITNQDFLTFYLNHCKTKYIYNLAYNKVINLLETQDINQFTSIPYFFEEEDKKNFLNKLSLYTIIELAVLTFKQNDINNKKCIEYKEYIQNIINENNNIIFNYNLLFNLDDIVSYLEESFKTKIENIINSELNKIHKYSNIKTKLNTYTSKANFIKSVNEGYINDNNYQFVYEMYQKNMHLFNTMNFKILNKDILQMGTYFIQKTSRFQNISRKVLIIYETNINKYNLLVKISNNISKENNNSTYDEKIEIFINYLFSNDITIPSNIDDKILNNIENYILDQVLNKNYYLKNTNITEFNKTKEINLNNQIKECTEINKIKSLIFEKYFGLNKIVIDDFYKSLVINWNSVSLYNNNNIVNKYIDVIKTINNIDDINYLKNLNLNKYTITDFMNIKGIMINTYNKSIENDIKNKQNGTNKKIIINNKNVEVTELIDNYGIFVHSTDAYGSMTLINDDYYDSWNYNTNTKNHGICTSYITNSNNGTAPVHKNGVMFGFTKIDSNSIPLLAPYDLMTINNGFTIKSIQKPFYCNLDTIRDYTRHTHNEISLERIIYEKDKSYLRQPDCIIIFEDMSDEIKENSIKAYEDFKKHNIDLKLIYIDRKKIALNESTKIVKLIKEYEETQNLDILEDILNLYHTNICSCNKIGSNSLKLIDENKLFNTKYIKNLLFKTIDYIENKKDQDLLNKFLEIINKEQYKFDIITEKNKNREQKSLLHDDKIKQKIENIKITNKYTK